MANTYKQPENIERDDFDRALDAALAKYTAVEPRTGLEERILTNLRTSRAQSTTHIWWRWSAAASLAAVVVLVVVLAWRSGRTSHPVIAKHPATTLQKPSDEATKAASRSGGEALAERHAPIREITARRVPSTTVIVNEPKLDQFPSPRPLSEEELALARYVREFPQEATLIAREQEEYDKEIQKKMREARAETEPSGSDQQ